MGPGPPWDGSRGGRAQAPVDRPGAHFPGPAVASSEWPGPILVMHIGTCQGLASQGLKGAPAGDFKSSNAFQKGAKTFCLTKASTGEEQAWPFSF